MNNVGSKGFIGGTGNTTNPYDGGGAQNNARALGSIGRALSQVGEVGLKIAGELQRAKLSKEEDSALNQLEISRGQMEADVMEIKDPEERIKRTDDALSKMKVEMFSRDFMPPVLKERLESTWGKFHARTKSNALIQSAQLEIEQAAGQSELIRYRHVENMDLEGYNSHVDQKIEMGVISPADGEMLKIKGEKEIKSRKFEVLLGNNPWEARDSIPSFGFNEIEKQRYNRMAEQEITIQNRDMGMAALDAIYDNPDLTDDQIIEMTPHMRSSERARIIDQRDRVNDAATQKEISSDSYQEALIGEVAGMLIDYDPTGTYEDDSLLVIKSKINQMKPGIVRDRLQARLNDTISRAESGWKKTAAKIKDTQDWAVKQLDEDFKARQSNIKVEKVPKIERSLRDHVKDGYYDDTAKMRELGFSDDEIEEIREAEDDTEPGFFGSLLPDNKVTIDAQTDKFKDLWTKRTGDVTADPDALKMANELAKGRGALDEIFSEVDDPQAKAVAEKEHRAKIIEERKKYAQALPQILEAFAADPKMSMEKAADLIESVGYDVEAGETGIDFEVSEQEEDGEYEAPTTGEDVEFKVFTGSRDQIKGFSSSEGSRMVALDFNDADNKSARGIEIVLPRSHSAEERRLAEDYVRQVQKFFKSKGVIVPIRQNGTGIKIGGGKAGVIHTEPFFAANRAARRAIMSDPEGYARLLGSTLGKIPNMTFIAPHTRVGARDSNPGEGARSGRFSERSFAKEVILPALMKIQK